MDDAQIRTILFRQRRFIRKEILRIKRLRPRVAAPKISIRRGCICLNLNLLLSFNCCYIIWFILFVLFYVSYVSYVLHIPS
jgi:hypothetical protein